MAEEEDARTQLQALQLEMEEFESQSAELEHALEEEKRMLEIDLEEAEQKVATFSKKVDRMEEERAVLITQRDQSTQQIMKLQDTLKETQSNAGAGGTLVRGLEQQNETLETKALSHLIKENLENLDFQLKNFNSMKEPVNTNSNELLLSIKEKLDLESQNHDSMKQNETLETKALLHLIKENLEKYNSMKQNVNSENDELLLSIKEKLENYVFLFLNSQFFVIIQYQSITIGPKLEEIKS